LNKISLVVGKSSAPVDWSSMEFGCASTWSQRVLSLTPIAQLSNPALIVWNDVNNFELQILI